MTETITIRLKKLRNQSFCEKGIYLKILLLVILVLSPAAISATSVDMVVLLDTSSSVMPIYDDLVNYIIGNVLTSHLRFGDTFHLISFDSEPTLIFSKQLRNKNDIEYVLKELFLLHPLGRYTDIVMALKYLRQYVSDISGTGMKEIIILTDGLHEPPPESPYQFIINPVTGENLLAAEINELNKSNWKLSIIQLPSDKVASGAADPTHPGHAETEEGSNLITGAAAGTAGTPQRPAASSSGAEKGEQAERQSGGETAYRETENSIFAYIEESSKIYKSDYLSSVDETNGMIATGSPRITYPESTGRINYHFKLPLEIENFYSYPLLLKLDKVIIESDRFADDGINILDRKHSISLPPKSARKHTINMTIPYGFPEGESSIQLKLVFSDENRAYPDNAEYDIILKSSLLDSVKKSKDVIIRILLVVIVCAAIAVFVLVFRYYTGVSVAESYSVVRKDVDAAVSGGKRRPVAMKVKGQNDQVIGNRNIHLFSEGTVKSVGGRSASFLIFLYRIPGIIANLEFDGENYILTPVNSEYFPEINGNSLTNPLDREIKVVTDKGFTITILFQEYVSKLEKINSIMKLTEHKGMTEERKNLLRQHS